MSIWLSDKACKVNEGMPVLSQIRLLQKEEQSGLGQNTPTIYANMVYDINIFK